MAKRIYIDGNVLIIQDNVTLKFEVEIPKRLVYIDRDLLDESAIIRFKYVNIDDNNIHKQIQDIALANAVTSGDIAYTAGTFNTFVRTNIGA